MASEHAPQPQHFPRPNIPVGRRGKRAHGFLSERDPIVTSDDDDNEAEIEHVAGPSLSTNLQMPQQQNFGDSGAGPSHQPTIDVEAPVSTFYTPGPSQPSLGFGYFSSMFSDPTMFTSPHNTQFFQGQRMQDLNQGFMTPNQPIPAYQSPGIQLFEPTGPTNNIQEEDDEEEQEEEDQTQQALQQPQRNIRRTRCGTGSHYM